MGLDAYGLTDNQSLCDTLYSTKSISDKRLKVDICMIHKIIENKEISQVPWIETKKQLALSYQEGCFSKSLLIALSGEIPLLGMTSLPSINIVHRFYQKETIRWRNLVTLFVSLQLHCPSSVDLTNKRITSP